jgi:subtilisin family serine protease
MNLDDQIRREKKEAGDSLPKVTVAVVDSGINSSHVIFKGTSISPFSKNLIEEEGDISDTNGHGTEVAGIIAESTPDNVELMAVKVFGDSTDSTTEEINLAIKYAVEKGADIINLSLSSDLHEILDSMEEYYPNLIANYLRETDLQLKYAAMSGVIVCAASGNSSGDLDELYSYPSYSQYTLAVGAINKNGSRVSFSNYGKSLDFCAPGSNVVMAANDSNNGYYVASGTSFATPYISACCAYVKMGDTDANYINAREALKAVCVDYGAEGWDKYYGWGMPHYEDFIDPEGDDHGAGEVVDPGDNGTVEKKAVKTVTVNTKTVSAAAVRKAIKKAGGTAADVSKIVLGKRVRKIRKNAFKGTKAKTLVVKTKKLKKKSVKGSLKGSKIKTVKIQVSKKKAINKKYKKKYRKIFTKKNAGRKVRVK